MVCLPNVCKIFSRCCSASTGNSWAMVADLCDHGHPTGKTRSKIIYKGRQHKKVISKSNFMLNLWELRFSPPVQGKSNIHWRFFLASLTNFWETPCRFWIGRTWSHHHSFILLIYCSLPFFIHFSLTFRVWLSAGSRRLLTESRKEVAKRDF